MNYAMDDPLYSESADADREMTTRLIEEEEERIRRESQVSREEAEASLQESFKPSSQPTEEKKDGPLRTQADENQETKDPSEWGPGEMISEARNAIAGGAIDAYNSIYSAPARWHDMSTLSPEEFEEKRKSGQYDMPWLQNVEDPIVKTWWGNLLKGISHYSTIGATGVLAVFGAAKAVPAIAPGLLGTSKLGIGIRGAAGSAATDLVSEYSQDENVSQVLQETDNEIIKPIVDHIPWMREILDPLATNDDDHPWAKTFKNVAEGIGLDALVGWLGTKFGKDPEVRQRNIDDQVVEKGKQEFDDSMALEAEVIDVEVRDITDTPALPPAGFRGHKNKPMADRWQGSPNYRGKAFDVMKDTNRMDNMVDGERGSTDSIFTPLQAERMAANNGMTEAEMKAIAKEYMTDERYLKAVEDAQKANMSFADMHAETFRRFQNIVGRDVEGMPPEEFWADLFADMNYVDGVDVWTAENVVVADLVNASLFKQIRDRAKAAVEISDIADLTDVDGPMKYIRDQLIVGLGNARKARAIWAYNGHKLNHQQRKAINEAVNRATEESKQAVDTFINIASKQPSDAVVRALAEAFSMGNHVNTFKDLDAYMRAKLHGGDFANKYSEPLVLRELDSIMVSSLVSGVRTPQRAAIGTFANSNIRMFEGLLGSAMDFSADGIRTHLAEIQGYFSALPESFELFKAQVEANWKGEFGETKYAKARSQKNDFWELQREWSETRGNEGDQLAFQFTDMVRNIANFAPIRGFGILLNPIDRSFGILMARARGKKLAMRKALDDLAVGKANKIDGELIEYYEREWGKMMTDSEGNIDIFRDPSLTDTYKEATLTGDLSGMSKAIGDAMNSSPFLRPFYRFARTGFNGINVSYQKTPLLGMLHKRSINIMNARPDNLDSVLQYGIRNADDLKDAQNRLLGMQAIGNGVVMMGVQSYLSGHLTGDFPADPALRQAWIDAGIPQRSARIPFTNTWVSYESFEPYNTILAGIANTGDNLKLMGPQWTENQFRLWGMVIGQLAGSKSYTQGISDILNWINGKPGSLERIGANLANNTVPLAGLRNDIGRFITPYVRELNAGIGDSIRNRNRATELYAGALPEDNPFAGALPIKYNIIYGEPVQNWHPLIRMYNAVSPVPINPLDDRPGMMLLKNSNYDIRTLGYSYKGISFKDHADVRSMFQRAIGQQGIGKQLDEMADNPAIIASIEQMNAEQDRSVDPKDYAHNIRIKKIFDDAKKAAWAKIKNDPKVQALIEEKIEQDKKQRNANRSSANPAQEILDQIQNR